jgi:subtilisin family serine protease
MYVVKRAVPRVRFDEMLGPARTLVPIAFVCSGLVLVPVAAARAPARVEIALDRTARATTLIRAARGLHVGGVESIRPLRVLVMRSMHPVRLIARLHAQPGVAAIALASSFRPADDTETALDPTTGIPYSWAFDAVDAGPAIAAVGGGSTFPVAVVDTGVDVDEPDLAGRISTLRHDTATGSGDVTDTVGHGTMVAGVIAMVAGNGIGGRGIAGATQIVPVRVTTTGLFFSDAVAKSIVWAVAHGIRVINLSLGGHELESPALTRAMAYASGHDALLVASAGNDGDRGNEVSYPAAMLGAPKGGWSQGLSVGATRPDGSSAAFSTYNTDVSVAAPGAGAADCPGGVFSTLPSEGDDTFADDPTNCDSRFGSVGDPVGGRYAYAQGTSFSAPIVSAVASLVLQANPALHAAQVADVIRRSAHQTVGTGWNPHTGAGVVDALAAVDLARTYDTVAPTLSFGVVRSGSSSLVASVTGVDQTGPGEALAGPGRSTVETSTDDRVFHVVAASAATPLRTPVPLRPGARIWIRGTACDGLHNCATQHAGPFHGAEATPHVRLQLTGYPGHVFHLRVQLGALANSYTARVRLEAWDGHAYRVFQTVALPFGGATTVKERVPTAGVYRLRAQLVAGPLWRAGTSRLAVRVR